jgi:hypothetical protein
MAIISFSRQFIFIKTRKTAGTSMEVHLAAACGPDDIVTPIRPERSGHQPRNFEAGFYNHMSATEIVPLLPSGLDGFFSFCFERHPIEKCLSFYAMQRNSPFHLHPGNPQSWDEYVDRGEFPVDVDQYTDGAGNLMVDRVYRYEAMDEALLEIESRTGISTEPELPREKSGFRYDVPTFSEVMARPKQKNAIMAAFGRSLMITPY